MKLKFYNILILGLIFSGVIFSETKENSTDTTRVPPYSLGCCRIDNDDDSCSFFYYNRFIGSPSCSGTSYTIDDSLEDSWREMRDMCVKHCNELSVEDAQKLEFTKQSGDDVAPPLGLGCCVFANSDGSKDYKSGYTELQCNGGLFFSTLGGSCDSIKSVNRKVNVISPSTTDVRP